MTRAAFRYLMRADAGGAWTDRWEGTVMLPVAVGIILDADTLVAPIGERR
jgi:hypothetical protein